MTLRLDPFQSARGSHIVMGTREDTMDFDVCMSSIQQDEYRMEDRPPLSGWAIDVGAHIGAVTVMLAMDNPDLRVLAVEIVPENVEVLRTNLERNRVADRVTIVHAAAGGPDELSRTCYMRHRSHPAATTAYVNKHRFIGNSFWSLARVADKTFDSEAVEMDTVSLGSLMEQHGIDEVAFLKTDAEGAEWAFLTDPAVGKVRTMIGEYHWDYAPQGDVSTLRKGAKRHKRAKTAQAELHALLDATHVVTIADHPSIGLFEATLR